MALKRFFSSDWFMAAVVLCAFLLTNRYIYGWDDQHLEIPLLKHLIDPQLFRGDYYVESLKANFTSFLFPILAKLIKVDWIPGVYLFLYLVSRYFLFFFLLKIWQTISGSRWIAVVCTLGLFLLVRPEEFIYRTFSHQEFSYIFVFAGFLLFFRSRYVWAAFVFGLGANIHALYSLFPMIYLSVYLLLFHKERKWAVFTRAAAAFIMTSLPFLIWTVSRALTLRTGHTADYYDGWQEMYRLSCPQNFIFAEKSIADGTANIREFFTHTRQYFLVAVLFLLNWRFNETFRKASKVHAIAIATTGCIAINFIFSYVWPSHFILDLNLLRHQQYLLLFLGGYTMVLACREGERSLLYSILMGLLLCFLSGKELPDVSIILLAAVVLECFRLKISSRGWLPLFLILAVIFAYAGGMYQVNAPGKPFSLEGLLLGWYPSQRWLRIEMTLGFIAAGLLFYALVARNNESLKLMARRFLVMSVLVASFISFCQLHWHYVQILTRGQGFWQLQRNWEDMQLYVKDHTPANALVLAPNDMEMGGFRIHSNRRVVVCYRDCGIVGFDYGATREWKQRMADVDAFKVIITEPFAQALLNGIFKYGADYVVFMNYAAPPDNELLQRMYQNEIFTLYKVRRK